MSKIGRIVVGGMTAVMVTLLAATAAWAADAASAKSTRIGPTVKTYKGDKCVEPTEEMRRNHMKYILHQRDKTMHQGIRTTKYSLKNCIDCHADPKTNSVLGKDGFCESCHEFAAVSIDCFSCHSPSPEKNGPAQKAAASASTRLIDMMRMSAVTDSADGNMP